MAFLISRLCGVPTTQIVPTVEFLPDNSKTIEELTRLVGEANRIDDHDHAATIDGSIRVVDQVKIVYRKVCNRAQFLKNGSTLIGLAGLAACLWRMVSKKSPLYDFGAVASAAVGYYFRNQAQKVSRQVLSEMNLTADLFSKIASYRKSTIEKGIEQLTGVKLPFGMQYTQLFTPNEIKLMLQDWWNKLPKDGIELGTLLFKEGMLKGIFKEKEDLFAQAIQACNAFLKKIRGQNLSIKDREALFRKLFESFQEDPQKEYKKKLFERYGVAVEKYSKKLPDEVHQKALGSAFRDQVKNLATNPQEVVDNLTRIQPGSNATKMEASYISLALTIVFNDVFAEVFNPTVDNGSYNTWVREQLMKLEGEDIAALKKYLLGCLPQVKK